MPSWVLVICYIAAAVSANLAVWAFGQPALVVTAVVLIPLDFLSRDILHARWERRSLFCRMSALVLGGSLVTWLANPAAEAVAIASAVSFGLNSTANASCYAAMAGRSRYMRMNSSNSAAAAVDSIAFPLLAFGVCDYRLSLMQTVLKVCGGLVVSAFYLKRRAADVEKVCA